jgi:hypothetical protein
MKPAARKALLSTFNGLPGVISEKKEISLYHLACSCVP